MASSHWQLSFSQDTTCSIIWYPAVQISDSSDNNIFTPLIALSGDDTVHVTWKGFTNVKYRAPYRRSTDGGKTWEPIMDLITDTVEYPVPFFYNFPVAQGQKVYMFSANEGNNNREIAMTVSTNGGTTWKPTVRIGPDSSNGLYSINLRDDTLVIVYAPWKSGFSKEPQLIYSTDAGSTWTKTNDTLDGDTRTAYISGTLHLIRNQPIGAANTKQIWYYQSHDLGNSYQFLGPLSNVNYDALDYAITAAPGGSEKLALSWRDARACAGFLGCTIMERESYNSGSNWTPEEVLTDQPWGFIPAIKVNKEGSIGIAWAAEVVFNTEYHVAFRFKKDQNSPWLPIVDHTPFGGGDPSLTLSSKAIHIVWEKEVENNGPIRINYRRGLFYTKTNTIDYESGWDLVSLPVKADTMYHLPSLFGYDGSYFMADSLERRKGYWAKPDSQITYRGSDVVTDTIDVKLGWNLIGSISCPVHVSTIQSLPVGIINSNFLGYKNSVYYIADLIEPGRGYWVKVKQAGKIILRAN
jgi:hypothetical protein